MGGGRWVGSRASWRGSTGKGKGAGSQWAPPGFTETLLLVVFLQRGAHVANLGPAGRPMGFPLAPSGPTGGPLGSQGLPPGPTGSPWDPQKRIQELCCCNVAPNGGIQRKAGARSAPGKTFRPLLGSAGVWGPKSQENHWISGSSAPGRVRNFRRPTSVGSGKSGFRRIRNHTTDRREGQILNSNPNFE